MTAAVFLKLVAIFLIVALGWVAGRLKWLGDNDPARTLSNAAFYIFIPALLFRTTARVQFSTLPWGILAAFFVPVLVMLCVVYVWQRRWNRTGRLPVAAPSVRAISSTFGNTLQIGVPMVTVAGMIWNAIFPPLPAVVDETLLTMSQAVVPLCLVLIGMSLAYYGVRGAAKDAIAISVPKLLVLPAVVLAAGHWGMGLDGTALAVIVMAASRRPKPRRRSCFRPSRLS